MAKWIEMLVRLVRQVAESQRERDRLGGRTTRRAEPRNRPVEHGVRVEYSPDPDGDADPGEVVWAWVPFREDPTRGKDRPVVVIGRVVGGAAAGLLVGVPLTSKQKGRSDHVAVGAGGWDPKRRPSWAKVDRLIEFDADDVRREGAVLDRRRFDDVVGGVRRHHDLAAA